MLLCPLVRVRLWQAVPLVRRILPHLVFGPEASAKFELVFTTTGLMHDYIA